VVSKPPLQNGAKKSSPNTSLHYEGEGREGELKLEQIGEEKGRLSSDFHRLLLEAGLPRTGPEKRHCFWHLRLKSPSYLKPKLVSCFLVL